MTPQKQQVTQFTNNFSTIQTLTLLCCQQSASATVMEMSTMTREAQRNPRPMKRRRVASPSRVRCGEPQDTPKQPRRKYHHIIAIHHTCMGCTTTNGGARVVDTCVGSLEHIHADVCVYLLHMGLTG